MDSIFDILAAILSWRGLSVGEGDAVDDALDGEVDVVLVVVVDAVDDAVNGEVDVVLVVVDEGDVDGGSAMIAIIASMVLNVLLPPSVDFVTSSLSKNFKIMLISAIRPFLAISFI